MSALAAFTALFDEYAGERKAITSMDQWLALVRDLKEEGLISELDGYDLGQLHYPSSSSPLTLDLVQQYLIRKYSSTRSQIVNSSVNHVEGKVLQVEGQLNLFHKHDPPLDAQSAERLTNLILELVQLHSQTTALFAGFPKAVDLSRGDEDVHTLVLEQIVPVAGSEKLAVPTAEQFQKLQSVQIEKALNSARVRRWSAQWSGKLIQQLPHGVKRYIAKNLDNSTDIEITSAPKYGVPLELMESLYLRANATRGLILSPFIPRFLGTDDLTENNICFLYELNEHRTLQQMVTEYGCVPQTSQLLIYWLDKILNALSDIYCQSTFPVVVPLTLANVRVSEDGLDVMLDGLQFGAEHNEDGQPLLLRSFSAIAAALIGVQVPVTAADCAQLPLPPVLRSILKCCVGAPGAPSIALLTRHRVFVEVRDLEQVHVKAFMTLYRTGHLP
eukprot:TRINITY_DN2342_c0_g1_i3.p1 TRINITY_DN2342_c0_g1~~TRINITY_DN2342_c0_g1_i3.p1  ORF type:complete len:444 (+),score=106.82 TRINITY_DN2342_c0_g1_i3:64-1395(+)